MFQGFKNAFSIFVGAISVFLKFPKLLFPLIIVWTIYAPVLVWLKFYYPWATYGIGIDFSAILITLMVLSMAMSFSCFILLDQIRQIETDGHADIGPSLGIAAHNTVRAIHITALWTVIWFVLTIAEMIFSRDNAHDNPENASPEAIAKTLGGYGNFSLSGAFFAALSKGVRLMAFLIYPSFAWVKEDKPVRRGFDVAKAHKTEFAGGFLMTELASMIVFIPPAILFAISEETTIPDGVWFATILYCGFAWSFSILLEQLFTAELFLWDLKWREACREADSKLQSKPELKDVPKPSLLDDIREFSENSTLGNQEP